MALTTWRSGVGRTILSVAAAGALAAGSFAQATPADTSPRREAPRPTEPGPAAGGAPSLRSAGPFFLAQLRLKVEGKWEKAWRSLHPLHQRVAPRATFVRCERATPFPARLEAIRVVRVRVAPVRVKGLSHPVQGAAITVAVELGWYGPRDPITLTYTFHLVPVQRRWTWLLSAERYDLYRRDECFVETGASS